MLPCHNPRHAQQIHPLKKRELHLFAGGGGGILGGILLGHSCVCDVELEPYCRKILLQRQRDGILPRFPIWDDVRTFDGGPWRGQVDIVCGGFPCQDISAAGSGAGINGERSGLWRQMARVVGEIRPAEVFVENSPLLVGRGLAVVLGDLAALGYDARWGVLGTRHIDGNCHGDRMWILAKAAEIGWSKVVCGKTGFGTEARQRWTPTYVDPRSRIDRIRTLEQLVGEPAILGGNDGMAHRLDRLHAIGNGQVPSVAALAYQTLSDSPEYPHPEPSKQPTLL